MSETDIVRAIQQTLAYRKDVWVWRNNTGALRDRTGRLMRFGLTGSADLLGVKKGGQLIALEVKKPGNSQTPEQIAFGAKVRALGGIYAVVHSPKEALEAIGE